MIKEIKEMKLVNPERYKGILEMLDIKQCTKCNLEKSVDEFYTLTRRDGSTGHHGSCKDCYKKRISENYRKNPEKKCEQSRSYERSPRGREMRSKRDQSLKYRIQHRWNSVKHRSEDRGIPFDLSPEDLMEQWKSQGGRCALSGVPLRYKSVRRGAGHRDEDSMSLDKINPELGYVKGNIQWLAEGVNRAKGAQTNEEYIEVCLRVLTHKGLVV